jgi:hypothetical protein
LRSIEPPVARRSFRQRLSVNRRAFVIHGCAADRRPPFDASRNLLTASRRGGTQDALDPAVKAQMATGAIRSELGIEGSLVGKFPTVVKGKDQPKAEICLIRPNSLARRSSEITTTYVTVTYFKSNRRWA